VKVQALITELGAEMADPSYRRWTPVDWLAYYNDAIRALRLVKPEAVSKRDVWKLTANETSQSLPADGYQLLGPGLVRNMGDDGATPGRSITVANYDDIARLDRTWHSTVGKTIIRHFCYNDQDKNHFWVYPRVHATVAVWVDGFYSFIPPDSMDPANDDLPVFDSYAHPVKLWMRYRAFLKNRESTTSMAAAQRAVSEFYSLFGIKYKADAIASPNNPSKGELK